MKYRIQRFFNMKNGYLIGMILMVAFVCVSTFSYALFTASAERRGALNIVSGNLYSLITSSSFNEQKQVIVNPSSSKTFEVKLTNVNGVDAKFNFYYSSTSDNIEIGYIIDKETPPTETGVLLKQNGQSGDSQTYLIQINNKDEVAPVTVTFGSDVGLSTKDLAFPNDKHILEEIKTTDVNGIPVTGKKDYNSATDDEKHGMFRFIHKNDETDETTIDYRYIGNNPYNYVNLLGTDAGKTDANLWRIIGVFEEENAEGVKEKRIKLILNERLNNTGYAWDNDGNYGSNNWARPAAMNTILNGAFWNGTSGNCPNDGNGSTTSCSFSSYGMSSVQDKIEKMKWKLGGAPWNSNRSTESFFSAERESVIPDGASATDDENVGLMYPSDYGYTFANGVSDICYNTLSNNNCNSIEGAKSWLWKKDYYQWTITPRSDYTDYVFSVYGGNDAYVNGNGAYNNSTGVLPVVYLKSSIGITGGYGTKTEPYTVG